MTIEFRENITMKHQRILHSTITGIIPAILEGVLVYSVEPTINIWILFQGVLFWFTCGFVVHLINSKNHRILTSIVYTVFLNLPWYIAESIVPNKIQHLLPLFIASIVLGFVIGFVSMKLHRREEK